MKTRPTGSLSQSASQSVSRAATDLTWMENRPLSSLDVKLVGSGGGGRQGKEEEEAVERRAGYILVSGS